MPAADASSPRGLPMVIVPALVIVLLLRRRHLIEGLLAGIVAAAVLASLTAGSTMPLLSPSGGTIRISPLAAGLHNCHSWALLIVIVIAVVTGHGRGNGKKRLATERVL